MTSVCPEKDAVIPLWIPPQGTTQDAAALERCLQGATDAGVGDGGPSSQSLLLGPWPWASD